MQIPIRCACGACREWAMIEFQGEIEVQEQGLSLNDLEVGTLCQVAKEKLMFTIGYHEVEGSLTTLKKPVAILKRRFAAPDASVSGADQVDGNTMVSEGFDVVGVIRRKYLFKIRPKAMISKPDESAKRRRVQTNIFEKVAPKSKPDK